MLQRRRNRAKQLINCSLRNTYFVAPSYSCKLPLKLYHSISTENTVSQNVEQQLFPSRLNKWNENQRTTHRTVAIDLFRRSNLTNLAERRSCARFFSNYSTGYQSLDRVCTIERGASRNEYAFSGLGATISRRNIMTSKKALTKALLGERFQALAKTIGEIKDQKKLATAIECLSFFERTIEDVSASKSSEPPTEQLETMEVAQTTATTVEATTTAMTCQAEPGQVLLESLKFTPEPEPYDPFIEFQIPEDVLQRRQLLKSGSVNNSWSHLLYQNEKKECPTVHYCKTVEDATRVAALFSNDKVLGFDLEWDPWAKVDDPSPRTQVSLMQIANQSDIALFHISLFKGNVKDLIPKNLRKILMSKDILKVGVNTGGDAIRIYKYLKITMQGVFELSDFKNLLDTVRKGGGSIPKRLISLANLTEQTLLLPLPKGKVRFSQWKAPLVEKQIRYAACDAYAGLRIFDALQTDRSKLRPCPPLPKCRVVSVVQEKVKKTRRTSGSILETTPEIEELISDLKTNASKAKEAVSNAPQRPKEVEEADKWVVNYMENEGSVVASRAQLRAYAMWHDGGHGVGEISSLLRTPPLKLSTVAGYILGAISLESLPYGEERLKEVFEFVDYPSIPFRLGKEAGWF